MNYKKHLSDISDIYRTFIGHLQMQYWIRGYRKWDGIFSLITNRLKGPLIG